MPRPNETPQAAPVGIPVPAPFPSSLPSGFQVIPVQVHSRVGQPGNTTNVKTPQTAVAIIGVTCVPQGAVTLHASMSLQVQNKDGSGPAVVSAFTFNRGTKSAIGIFPLNPELQQVALGITLQAADTGTIDTFVLFLIGPTRAVPLTAVPFRCDGNPDGSCVVTQTATSVANTAQTLDTTNTAQLDALEIIAAWFYTSGGTATGNAGYWDGTTRVDIDTTAAVASYVFNVGAKGPNPTIWNGGQVGTHTFRVVIGTAGVGNTSTLIVVYRTRLLR